MMTDIKIEKSRGFYDSYYQKKKQTKRTYSAILKHFKVAGRLLDIACGDGQFLASLPNHIVTSGCDISLEALSIAETNRVNAFLSHCSAENLLYPDRQFDYVTCFGSIEHFVNRDEALKEMKRVGKYACKYLFVVPNSKFNIVSITKGKVGTEQAENIEELHTKEEWREIFEQAGFWVEKIEKFPVYKKSWAWLKRIIYWLIPLRFDEQFLFVCWKI